MSQDNITIMKLGSSSKKNAGLIVGLFWQYQQAIAKDDSQELARVMAIASAEHADLPNRFYSVWAKLPMFVSSDRDGKGNPKFAGFPAFEAKEVDTEKVKVNQGNDVYDGVRRQEVLKSAFDKVDYITSSIYDDSGNVSDSPNNESFWRKGWYAFALNGLGQELPNRQFQAWQVKAKLDKRTLVAEILQDWRTMSPSMMFAKHSEILAQRESAKQIRTKKADTPVKEVETVST